MRPVPCVSPDRLRLIVITNTAQAAPRDLLWVVAAALRAGAPAVQLREKGAPARDLLPVAERLRELTVAHGALLFVNDRLDVVLASGADGVHLGPDDVTPSAARSAAPEGFLIGYSADDPGVAPQVESNVETTAAYPLQHVDDVPFRGPARAVEPRIPEHHNLIDFRVMKKQRRGPRADEGGHPGLRVQRPQGSERRRRKNHVSQMVQADDENLTDPAGIRRPLWAMRLAALIAETRVPQPIDRTGQGAPRCGVIRVGAERRCHISPPGRGRIQPPRCCRIGYPLRPGSPPTPPG